MDNEIRKLDRDYIINYLTVKAYPVPGYDEYELKLYFKGEYFTSIKVDGLELEMWRHKDNADPDSYVYDESPRLIKANEEISQKHAEKEWKKKYMIS